MSRQRYFRAVIITIVAVTTITTTFFTSFAPSLRAQSFSATLTPVAGLVQFLAHGTTDWVNVQDTRLVHPGDQIRTGNDGFARINVITGIDVEIYPTSQVELNTLSMQDERGEVFDLHQMVGVTFTDIHQTISDADRIQIVLPTAGITAHGTKFFTFLSPNLDAGVLSQEHTVLVDTADNRHIEVAPDNFLFIKFDLAVPLPLICAPDVLATGSLSTFVVDPLDGDKTRIQAVRDFLGTFLVGNVNPPARTFLRDLLGLPEIDLTNITPEDDRQELRDLIAAVDSLSTDNLVLPDFLTKYRNFWGATYRQTFTDQFPPPTCGNGRRDEGETPELCPSDFTDVAACGNGMCETNRGALAESVVSCPADCLPNDKLAASCIGLTEKTLNPPVTPSPTLRPSGVGR